MTTVRHDNSNRMTRRSFLEGTLTGCAQPVAFAGQGSDTSFFRNNLIERGGVTNATNAVVVTGQFRLTGNHIANFGAKETSVK